MAIKKFEKGEIDISDAIELDSDSIEMDDGELENVSGGFKSNKGFSKGLEVICPVCGNKDRKRIRQTPNPYCEWDVFICNDCDMVWGLCQDGEVDIS